MPENETDREKLSRLRNLMLRHFSIAELDKLYFDLDVDYEELEGTTKSTKLQNLITYLDRRSELPRLLDAVVEERPRVNWPDLARKLVASTASERLWQESRWKDARSKLRNALADFGHFSTLEIVEPKQRTVLRTILKEFESHITFLLAANRRN